MLITNADNVTDNASGLMKPRYPTTVIITPDSR